MKLTRITSVMFVAMLCTSVLAQQVKVTVDVKAAALEQVLKTLEKDSKVQITLEGEGRTPVTLTLVEVDLETALKYVCRSAQSEYSRTDKGFLVKNPNPLPPELEQSGSRSATRNPLLLVMADFTEGGSQNNLGGYFGTFGGDNQPNECKANMSFVGEDALDRQGGKSLRVDFDNPSRPFYSGLWMCTNPLENEDLGGYDRIGFWARADGIGRLLLVVKDRTGKDDYSPRGVGQVEVPNLTGKWRRYEVMFKDFQPQLPGSQLNWKSMRQFVFVCQDGTETTKGYLSLDEIYFSKGPRPDAPPAPQ